jgi:CPA1 family monovalent cation:H+ antiporter
VNDIEVLIALVAAAAVMVRIADLIAIPYPIVLVVGGIAIAAVPGGPTFDLDPDVIFLVFLPPLLQSAGYYSSARQLRAELAPLSFLVLGLTLLTMVAVALVAHTVIPGLDWGEALLLGAIVAPTDPVAAVATFERVGVQERVKLLVEGESMVNDATALVAYRVALAAIVSGSFAAGEAGMDLVVSVVGGIAIGFAIAWAAVRTLKRLDDAPLVILISVLAAYISFAASEEVHASGVLAVVTAGLYMGARSHEVFDADMRLNAQAFWEVLVFALNIVLFILLGLQLPDILDRVQEVLTTGQILGYGLLISAVVITVRVFWQFLPEMLGRVFPGARRASTGEDWRERLLVGWSGMRGAVSLAAALALPLTLDSGAAFSDRDLIIYLTVAVIVCTLVLQGLTLPWLIRVLGLGQERVWAPDEAVARLETAQAVLDELEEVEAEADEGVADPAIERLREQYRARFARCVAAIAGEGQAVPVDDPLRGYRSLRRRVIGVERRTLVGLRDEGKVKPDVFRRIQRDLDLEEARLREG